MLFAKCHKCGNQLPSPGNYCDRCSASTPVSANRGVMGSLGQFARANWLFLVIAGIGGAGVLCLAAPAAGGTILLLSAVAMACWMLFRWMGVFSWLSRWASASRRTPVATPDAASVSRTDLGRQAASGSVWLVIILIGVLASQTLSRPHATLRAIAAANQTTANQQAIRGTTNESYWKDAVLRAFQEDPEAIEAGETISSLLDHEFARQKVSLAYIRGRPTGSVDQDLVQAVAKWTAAQERLLQWCEQNKSKMLAAAMGLSVEELSASGDVDIVALVQLLPPEQLSPEIAELKQVLLDLDSTLTELDHMQIRLSERYRDHRFLGIGD